MWLTQSSAVHDTLNQSLGKFLFLLSSGRLNPLFRSVSVPLSWVMEDWGKSINSGGGRLRSNSGSAVGQLCALGHVTWFV